MLSYLSLGRVFASFMTGNILFTGLGVAQGNSGLLIRALVAVLVFLVGAAFAAIGIFTSLVRGNDIKNRQTQPEMQR